ncbi:MAG: thioredoxin family protein [Dissulfurispiraceae bacterium]|nr:thioredoxin family protein [Dissulfurispiraceae bacterium]
MTLFRKKKIQTGGCDCGGACDINAESMEQAKTTQAGGAAIKILGSGCKKCITLEANTKTALQQLGMDTAIDHVTDFTTIAAYGVMTTPALVYNGKVLSYGKVLKTEEVVKLLQAEK